MEVKDVSFEIIMNGGKELESILEIENLNHPLYVEYERKMGLIGKYIKNQAEINNEDWVNEYMTEDDLIILAQETLDTNDYSDGKLRVYGRKKKNSKLLKKIKKYYPNEI